MTPSNNPQGPTVNNPDPMHPPKVSAKSPKRTASKRTTSTRTSPTTKTSKGKK